MVFPIFATASDLLPVLEAVESRHRIKYVRRGPTSGPHADEFTSGSTLPHLGVANHPAAIGVPGYLVADEDTIVQPQRIVSRDGTVWFTVDQMLNPDTIEFSPGGMWQDVALLSGRIETISDTAPAQRLLRAYRAAVRKRFGRIRAYWVGPEAEALLDAGVRLTAAVASPTLYDLRRVD